MLEGMLYRPNKEAARSGGMGITVVDRSIHGGRSREANVRNASIPVIAAAVKERLLLHLLFLKADHPLSATSRHWR